MSAVLIPGYVSAQLAFSRHKFTKTYCSQCGAEFGHGNQGYSRCADHYKEIAMSFLCAVEHDLRAYQSRVDADAGLDREIEKRVSELLSRGSECDPLDSDNLFEAISEVSMKVGTKFPAKLGANLRSGHHAAVCELLTEVAFEYWKPKAQELAQEQIAQERNDYPCCGGRGCARCERSEY